MTGGSINKKKYITKYVGFIHTCCTFLCHSRPEGVQTKELATETLAGVGGGGGSQDTESCIKDQLQHNYFIFGQSSKHPEMSRCPINKAHQVLS